MAIIPPDVHIVETAVYNGTSLTLTVTNSLNIGNNDPFVFRCPVTVRDNITGSPVPVFVNINGVATIPLEDKFGRQILSDRVPKSACGNYIVPTTEGETPYVILLTTPRRRR
jgi:hypothetical protein